MGFGFVFIMLVMLCNTLCEAMRGRHDEQLISELLLKAVL